MATIELELFGLAEAYAGALWFPFERAGEVLHAWRDLTHAAPPDELVTLARFCASAVTMPELSRARTDPEQPVPAARRLKVRQRRGQLDLAPSIGNTIDPGFCCAQRCPGGSFSA